MSEASPSPLPAGAPLSPAADPEKRRSWRDFFLLFFGSSPPDTPPPNAATAGAEEGRRLRPGDVLGDWEVLSHLGSGGMGDVYKAFNRRDHRRYALKVLSPKHRDSPSEVARFELEYLALTRVRHEGIVTPFVAGCEDGIPYYTMELLEGESLDRAYTRERLSSLRAAQVGVAVAQALAVIHSAGIIHRDLKPANIFLVKGGGVKLLDLGIAKLLPEFYEDIEQRLPPEARPRTDHGVHLGTQGYMAPETAQGAEASPAQDIYGLAVTLCRAITGRFPYHSIIPPGPDDEPNLEIDSEPAMHPALEDVLRQALAVRPSSRQSSMTELRVDLELVIAEMEKEIAEPVGASAPRLDAPIVIESAAPARAKDAVEEPAAPAPEVPAVKNVEPRPLDDRRPSPPLYLREPVLRGLILLCVFAVFGVGILAGIRSERAAQSGLRSAAGLGRAVTRAVVQAPAPSPSIAVAAVDDDAVDADHIPGDVFAAGDAGDENDVGEALPPVELEEPEPAAPADASTPPPRRRGLARAAFREAIAPHRAALDLCVRDVPGTTVREVVADITAGGDLEAVRLSPASTYIATRCVDRTLRGVRFPRTQARSTHRLTLGGAERKE